MSRFAIVFCAAVLLAAPLSACSSSQRGGGRQGGPTTVPAGSASVPAASAEQPPALVDDRQYCPRRYELASAIDVDWGSFDAAHRARALAPTRWVAVRVDADNVCDFRGAFDPTHHHLVYDDARLPKAAWQCVAELAPERLSLCRMTKDTTVDLAALSGVRWLELGGREWHDEIGVHPKLERLYLEVGELPDNPASAMPKLRTAYFGGYAVRKSLPEVFSLTQLRKLVFRGIAVEDEHLKALAQFADLEVLGIYKSTKVTGSGLASLGGLKNFRELALGTTELSRQSEEHLAALRNLEVLDLSSTSVSDDFIVNLPRLKLHTLSALMYALGKDGFNKLASHRGLANLGVLSADSLFFKPKEVAWMVRLRTLRTSWPGLLPHLDQMPKLEELRFVGNPFTHMSLARLAQTPELRTLTLRKSKVDDDDLVHVAKLTKLEELDLSYNAITDKGLAHLTDLANLRVLNLYGTQITNESMKIIGRMKRLEKLDVGRTNVTNEGVAHLSARSRLRWLSLTRNGIATGGLKPLEQLPRLRWLNLARTGISADGLAHVLPDHLHVLDIWETSAYDDDVDLGRLAARGVDTLEKMPREGDH